MIVSFEDTVFWSAVLIRLGGRFVLPLIRWLKSPTRTSLSQALSFWSRTCPSPARKSPWSCHRARLMTAPLLVRDPNQGMQTPIIIRLPKEVSVMPLINRPGGRVSSPKLSILCQGRADQSRILRPLDTR